ncbi:hypothetical protein RAA17_09250 [Komagataeibacter rhaeticus]|nr:hypothetical protein [Komagataeibacter rhaeticus]
MQDRIAIKRGRFPMVCPTLLRQRITPHRQAAQAGQRPDISIAQFMDLSHMIQQIMWITWIQTWRIRCCLANRATRPCRKG